MSFAVGHAGLLVSGSRLTCPGFYQLLGEHICLLRSLSVSEDALLRAGGGTAARG